MFTGLIEEVGELLSRETHGDGERFRISASVVLSDVKQGDSISVSGACLTVIEHDEESFVADVMAETLRHSSLGTWKLGKKVNLERAAAVGDRLGGHIVQGHVDAQASVLSIVPGDQWQVVRLSLAAEVAPLVVHKGSLALDGVSLTVSGLGEDWCEVSLIPETLRETTLGDLTVGQPMNVETDILARHVQRLLETGAKWGGA